MQRYEMKYVANRAQTDFLKSRTADYVKPDEYGLTSIASLYFDTPDKRLIRASIEKPAFKEKIRLRSYGLASENSTVYLELKRKALGTVYKRRVPTTVKEAENFFGYKKDSCGEGQISKEITFFRDNYKTLVPSCLIVYDRTAYSDSSGSVRLTIDEKPRYRVKDLDLTSSLCGKPLLEDGYTIIEIKVAGAMPLWLASALSEGKIYKTCFSKYGEAYKKENGYV